MSDPTPAEPAVHIEPAPGLPGVLIVTLDNPPVNAVSLAQFRKLRAFFTDVAETHPDTTCIILTARGKVFCAGADVRELSVRTTESQMARSVVSRGTFDAIRRCPVPVIGAVGGAAIGAGAVIASCCDIIIASDRAKMSLPEIVVGVMGGGRHMARILPDKWVRYLAMTGRSIDAATLERLGAVQMVVPHDALLDETLSVAGEIARHSPTAARLMKEAINLTEDMPITEGYRVEQLFTTLASSLPDSKEAALAFLEKRKPVWGKGN